MWSTVPLYIKSSSYGPAKSFSDTLWQKSIYLFHSQSYTDGEVMFGDWLPHCIQQQCELVHLFSTTQIWKELFLYVTAVSWIILFFSRYCCTIVQYLRIMWNLHDVHGKLSRVIYIASEEHHKANSFFPLRNVAFMDKCIWWLLVNMHWKHMHV